ncbi:cytochrome c oxidase subunit 3 [Nocardioides montaniterrae]
MTAEPAVAPVRHVPGEEGLWVFVLGDMTIFGLFFGTILTTRAKQPEMFAASQAHLHPVLGILNTVLLLTASLLVVRGLRGARHGRGVARGPVLLALICALGFAAVKVTEYVLLAGDGFAPGTNDFFMYYFVFTGIHLAHLAIGVGVLTFLARTARLAELTEKRVLAVECGGVYWHMVDMLWLVLFPLLYLVR